MNKITRKKNSDYTVVSNVFLRDKNLSIKAKGFLAVVMGLPDNWEFTINGICSILKEGKTAVYNVINELKDAGYCKAKRIQNEKGIIQGYDYSFFEMPQCEEQDSDNPYTENPHMDNQPQLSKEGIKYEINKEERDKSLSKKEKPLWKTNFAEYQKLVEEARATLKSDDAFRQQMLKFHPNADYDLSIDKSVETFWITEAGWNNKKKSRANSIDMVATLKRNFDRNIVYVRYGQKARFDNYEQTTRKEDKLIINGMEYE